MIEVSIKSRRHVGGVGLLSVNKVK